MYMDSQAYINSYWAGESVAIAKGMILVDYREGDGPYHKQGHIDCFYFKVPNNYETYEEAKKELISFLLAQNREGVYEIRQILIASNLWALVEGDLRKIQNEQRAKVMLPEIEKSLKNIDPSNKYKTIEDIARIIGCEDC